MSPVVDVHAHVFVPEVERLVGDEPFVAAYRARVAAGQDGHTRRVNTALVNGRWGRELTDPTARLAAMDRMGVDVQLLSIAGNQYHYGAPESLARELVELANDRIAATVAARPDRLSAMATVALQFPELAAEQLTRACSTHGMRAVVVSSRAGGRDFSHPAYEPFWHAAEQTGALVFVHPLGCSLGPRLRQAYLGNIVGQPVETTVALSHLIFGGVLDRHPRLRLCAAHGGGYLPHYIGRSDHAYAVRPDSRTPAEPPSHYLGRIHYDTVVHSAHTLGRLVATVGAGQVLLGSDYPYDMGSVDPLGELAAAGLRAC